jgi:hypothetical protein
VSKAEKYFHLPTEDSAQEDAISPGCSVFKKINRPTKGKKRTNEGIKIRLRCRRGCGIPQTNLTKMNLLSGDMWPEIA